MLSFYSVKVFNFSFCFFLTGLLNSKFLPNIYSLAWTIFSSYQFWVTKINTSRSPVFSVAAFTVVFSYQGNLSFNLLFIHLLGFGSVYWAFSSQAAILSSLLLTSCPALQFDWQLGHPDDGGAPRREGEGRRSIGAYHLLRQSVPLQGHTPKIGNGTTKTKIKLVELVTTN